MHGHDDDIGRLARGADRLQYLAFVVSSTMNPTLVRSPFLIVVPNIVSSRSPAGGPALNAATESFSVRNVGASTVMSAV